MTIKFIVEGSTPVVTYEPCKYGEGEPWACVEGNRCGYCNDGTEEVHTSVTPEAEFSNQNAANILRALGFQEEDIPYMEVPYAEIASIRRSIVRLLNRGVGSLTSTASDTKRHGKVRIIQAEVTEESVIRRLTQLDAVCKAAQERQVGIRWY